MGLSQKRPAATKADSPSKRVRVEATQRVRDDGLTLDAPPSPAITDADSIPDSAMTTHTTSRQRPKKYVCDFEGCDKAYDRPIRLQTHQRTHTGDRPFVCKEAGCSKSFFKSEHLKAHVKNNHADDASHVCAYVVNINDEGEEFQCGKAFTTATRLRRHVAAHEQKESLKCHEIGCGKTFRKMDTLQRHIKQDHLHEKAFRCTQIVFADGNTDLPYECGQEFATAGQLKTHENRAHMLLRHFCEICSPPKATQEQHADRGTEIDLMDEISRVGFATYGEYQHHLKTVHPPTCEICGQACESRRALAAHKDIEHSSLTDRQKFPCTHPGCGRSFTRPGNLQVHIRNVHAKQKKFVCGQFDLSGSDKCPDWDGHGCGMAFGTKANLENHTRTQHLGLPTLLKRRMGVKNDKSLASPGMTTSSSYSSMDIDESAEIDAHLLCGTADQRDAIGLLTGYGYEQSRPIACWVHECPVRFTRDYDLAQHMELKHGWQVDDINERLAEEEALSGEQFWIGGEDELEQQFETHCHAGDMSAMDRALVNTEDGMDDRAMFNASAMPSELGKPSQFEEELAAAIEGAGAVVALDPALPATVEAS